MKRLAQLMLLAVGLALSMVATAGADDYAPVTAIGGTGQLNEPAGVAVASDGTVFVANTMSSRIDLFRPQGNGVNYELAGTIDLNNLKNPKDPEGLRYWVHTPRAIAVDTVGQVYVVDLAFSDDLKGDIPQVQRLSPAQDGSGSYALTATLTGGHCYPPPAKPLPPPTGELCYDPKLAFDSPAGVAIDSQGDVFISERGGNRVQECKLQGTDYESCRLALGTPDKKPGYDNGQLHSPEGIAVDGQGNLYVADAGNFRVQRFTPGRKGGYSASRATWWGTEGPAQGEFLAPAGVAVSSQGEVFVTDANTSFVQKFNPVSDGTSLYSFAGVFGGLGIENSQLEHPLGAAVDSQGYVYVADTGNGRVTKFGPDQDADGVADLLDNCPSVPNPDQADPNGNGIGAACDPSDAQVVTRGGPNDTTPPSISGFKALSKRIHVRGKRAVHSVGGFRFRLSEDATVTIKVSSVARGNGRTRKVFSLVVHGKQGSNTAKLKAKYLRRLSLGQYLVTVRAQDGAGNNSQAKHVHFKVSRR